ncbi:heme-binding protein [uncultured Jatrophihabitans sp.]|uniref:heme-binding protein n=1 Tax=uncultured Jatrophihabitans sp. TaxID=1610747 RepID=UPI0035CACDBF
MADRHPRDLPLADAQALVRRAIDKGAQLGLRGGIAVVGASGALITASRLDAGGQGGMGRARSKAWISGTQQIPSTEHLHRMTTIAPPVAAGFATVSPQAVFPGAGGMPVVVDGVVVAGIAASGSTVSPFFPVGVDPKIVSADGKPANPEDLLIAYALGIPYVGQHGDDAARWAQRFGELTVAPEDSLGMAEAPPAADQPELEWARSLSQRVLAAAASAGKAVSVAVVDRGGDPVQQDRADDGVAAGPSVALATATAAALFGWPSHEIATRYPDSLTQLAALHPDPMLFAPGGAPVLVDGRVVGGVGVGGVPPQQAAELVAAALS